MDPGSAIAAVTALLGFIKSRGGGSSDAVGTGLPPQLQNELLKMLTLQSGRAERVEPVHKAAMAMASRMAPAYARSAMGSGGGNQGPASFAATASPTLTGNSLGASYGSGGFNPAAARDAGNGSPFTNMGDSGFTRIGNTPYAIPGGSARPVTGPEDPDPMHHPMDANTIREVSEAMQRFFMANPANAFFGSGMSGSGDQNWSGGRGRAR